MSETSAEYRAGFATLLPAVWQPGQAASPTWCRERHKPQHIIVREAPCPNIREDDAAAWRAVMALRAMERVLFTCHLINGMTPVDALYATIEGIGRRHDRRT